ncbi:MAG: response regulator [Dehalococcoidia bacterium]
MTEVLLAEDEAPIASVLARNLTAHGFTVRTAGSGKDTLLSIAESIPDVLLLDVNLPDITGWEVLRRLSDRDRERIPVIVYSASPLAPSRVQEFKPAGVLSKPFPVDALLRLLREVTESRPGG